MTIRVMMLGPGKIEIGGILTLTETIMPLLEGRVNLMYFPTVKRRPLKLSGKLSLRNIALAVNQYARFFPALLRFRPQIVHLHTSQGLAWLKDTFYVVLAKFFHTSVVLHIHAPDFDEFFAEKSCFIKFFTRRVMCLADAIIAVSEEWKNRLESVVPNKQVSALKNCYKANSELFNSLPNSEDKVIALFLGSVGPRKGAFDLLEAMSRLKAQGCSLIMWIAGYEERKGDLIIAHKMKEQLKLGDCCQLLGTVTGKKKAKLLREANLFVLPSYDEGLPMAVLEAMAAGLAVIATPVGGIPEVVKDGYNGFLVKPGDVKEISEKLMVLAKEPKLRDLMGKRSREILEHELDVKPYVDRLVTLYESLLYK